MCLGAFCLLGSLYNILMDFRHRRLFALIALGQAVLWWLAAATLLPWIKGWALGFEQLATLVLVWLIEVVWIALIARLERAPEMEPA